MSPHPRPPAVIDGKSVLMTGAAAAAQHSAYLPHLDGVRALALLGVLAFHFKLPHFCNGFLGVDSFLVLSGYLMTRNILRALHARTFSLSAFYVSRFWRLYPSALAVTAAALTASFLVALPDHALEACQSGLASMFFVSNLYFYAFSRYFDPSSEHRPLLHTWSLSLEEQFYAVWPAVLLFSFNLMAKAGGGGGGGGGGGRRLVLQPTVFAISAASFAVLLIFASSTEFTFYLLPARIFEFGVGSILHLLEDHHRCGPLPLNPANQGLLSAIGLALLLASYSTVLQANAGSLSRSIAALCGTALLIATPEGFLSHTFLSTRFMRYLGKISYAAYLTHWPLWVFAGTAFSRYRHHPLYVYCVAFATFSTARALHEGVEKPFRGFKKKDGRSSGSWRPLLSFLLATIALAVSGHVSDGWSFRFPRIVSDSKNRRLLHEDIVEINPGWRKVFDPTASNGCLVGKGAEEAVAGLPNPTLPSDWLQNHSVQAVVVGNSFVRHLTSAFKQAALLEEGAAGGDSRPIILSWRASCRMVPLSALPPDGAVPNRAADPCLNNNYRRWEILQAVPKNTTVFLSQNWDINSEKPEKVLLDELHGVTRDMLRLELRPVLVTNPPGAGKVSYLCHDYGQSSLRVIRLLGSWFFRDCPSAGPPRRPSALAYKKMMEFARNSSLSVLDIYGHLCHAGDSCPAFLPLNGEDVRLYVSDGYHLSYDGSRALGPFFRQRLAELT